MKTAKFVGTVKKEEEKVRRDITEREWDSKKYEGILVDSGCQHHFWFFKNQKELREIKGANEEGWETFYSLRDFEEYEDSELFLKEQERCWQS